MKQEEFEYEPTEEEIERQEQREHLPHESLEWEKWGDKGAQSPANLIAIATELATNAITIQESINIIFATIERQQLKHYIDSNDYHIFFGQRPTDFELLQNELATANQYRKSIEHSAAFNTYTSEELKQGFDAKGNLTEDSPFQQDFMQAFHALQAHAEYAATEEYITIIREVTQSISEADKKKIECPIIWERLKKEWEQAQELLSYSIIKQLSKRITPKTHTSPNTRLSNELNDLLNDAEGQGPVDLRVSAKRKRNELTAYVVAYSSESIRILEWRQFTEYDRQVHDAIVSLWIDGHEDHIITSGTVFKAMTGTKVDPKPKQKETIIQSIEKMRRIFVEIDATDEIKAYRKKNGIESSDDISVKWNDAILSLKKIRVKIGKRKTDAYVINQEPILLSYAKATNKLLSVSTTILDIKEIKKGQILGASISNTESRIAIKGYLLRRVMTIKHDQKTKNPHLSKTIRFDKIFEETGAQAEDRVTMRRYREYVFQVLDYWKASGFIEGYTKNTGNNHAMESVTLK